MAFSVVFNTVSNGNISWNWWSYAILVGELIAGNGIDIYVMCNSNFFHQSEISGQQDFSCCFGAIRDQNYFLNIFQRTDGFRQHSCIFMNSCRHRMRTVALNLMTSRIICSLSSFCKDCFLHGETPLVMVPAVLSVTRWQISPSDRKFTSLLNKIRVYWQFLRNIPKECTMTSAQGQRNNEKYQSGITNLKSMYSLTREIRGSKQITSCRTTTTEL